MKYFYTKTVKLSSLINDSFTTDFERQFGRFKGIRLIDCSQAVWGSSLLNISWKLQDKLIVSDRGNISNKPGPAPPYLS